MRRLLSQIENIRSTTSSVFRYRNPDTQVACDFVFYEPEGEMVGLSYEMALPRPLFFAFETLPLVVQVAREFSLDVEIVSPDNDMPCCEPTFEVLLHHWQLANRDEVLLLESQGCAKPALDNQSLESMWEFMLLRAELARRYNRSHVAVPPVELVRELDTGKVSRVVRWRGLLPAGLADSDYVWLEDPPAPLKSDILISSSAVRELAKFAFRDLSQPVNHRLFDKAKVQADLVQALHSAPGLSAHLFEVLGYKEVVDRDLTPLLEG